MSKQKIEHKWHYFEDGESGKSILLKILSIMVFSVGFIFLIAQFFSFIEGVYTASVTRIAERVIAENSSSRHQGEYYNIPPRVMYNSLIYDASNGRYMCFDVYAGTVTGQDPTTGLCSW